MTIQLKQPNFAVFYSSFCNISRNSTDKLDQATPEEESLSVREAVKLAKEQNMLGIVLDRRILVSKARGRVIDLHPDW
jgi:CDK inhibitor PHO81